MKNTRKYLLMFSSLALITLILMMPTAKPSMAADISVTGTVQGAVSFNVSDSSIAFGTLNLATQSDSATIGGETRKVWDSENDATTSPDKATFDESTTNVNASYYLTVTGETVSSLDSTNWLYFKKVGNTFDPDGSGTTFGAYGTYWLPSFSGTLGSATSYTPPSGETAESAVAINLTILGSNDGTNWQEISITIHVLHTTSGKIYLDDDTNFSDTTEGGYISEVGPLTAQYDEANLFGNPFILMEDPTTLSSGNTVTFRFGWFVQYDGTPSNYNMEFYTLLAIPTYTLSRTWTWQITINGVQHA